MTTPRKKRASRAKPASSPLKSSPSTSSPLKSSPAKSSPLKPSKATKKLPSIPAANMADHVMEDVATFDNEQSSTLLSPEDHLDQDAFATNGEQSSAAQASPSVFADNQDEMRAPTASELQSLPLLSNPPLPEAFVKQLRELFPSGLLVPPMARTHDIDTYPIAHKGFEFSLFECSVVCAIRMFVQNNDGSRADDDTAAEVLKAIRGTMVTIDCEGLYEHIMLKGSSGTQDKDDWEMQVYNDLQNRKSLWAATAQLYWKGWIACMNNISRSYKREDRLGELTELLPMDDLEPFRSIYEFGQPLSFIKQQKTQRNGQRPNQARFPSQMQPSTQWVNKSAILNPMQMQMPYQGSNQTTWPMAPQTQMLMSYPWEHQVAMPGPASVPLQNQWGNQAAVPVMAKYPTQGASQMLDYHPLQAQRRGQMLMQMGLQNQGYISQMQQMHAEAPPLIPSNPELQMPAPTGPANQSDIADLATQMLTPFPTQTPMLASQPLGAPRRRSYYHEPLE